MGPIDYSSAFGGQDPLQAFAGSFNLGAGIQDRRMGLQQQQLAMQQAQAKAQQEQAMRAELADVASNPTLDRIASLSVKYPQLSEGFKRSYDMLAPESKQSKLNATIPIYAAALNGKPETSASLLEQQAEALSNSGREQEASQTLAFAEMFRTQPETAKQTAGLLLSSVMGPDKFVETFGKLGSEQRAADLQPTAMREAAAKATSAEVAATNAPLLAEQELKKNTAAAIVEETKATTEKLRVQYAPQRVKLEVEKLGAELGLTRAQTAQAGAAAAASRESTAASQASAARDRAGILPPDKRMEGETKLRKEYSDQTKTFQDVRESYRRVNASQDNAVGDLSLIFGFMKMLDPGSVVREGEFATAQNAAGIPDRIQNLYNKALRGERLTKGQRDAFKGQAQQLYGAAEKQEKVVRDGLGKVASVYGLDTKNIFFDQPKKAPPTPAPAPGGKPPSQAEVEAALSKYLPKPK